MTRSRSTFEITFEILEGLASHGMFITELARHVKTNPENIHLLLKGLEKCLLVSKNKKLNNINKLVWSYSITPKGFGFKDDIEEFVKAIKK